MTFLKSIKCFWPQLLSTEVPILCQRLEDFTEDALTHGFVPVCIFVFFIYQYAASSIDREWFFSFFSFFNLKFKVVRLYLQTNTSSILHGQAVI